MNKRTTFGKDPDRLSRLLAMGLPRSDQAPENDSAAVTLDSFTREQPGSRIGRYTLIEVVGEGGMGIVYLAHQKRPVRRQVALKVIKPGMDSKRIIARFEAEQQALALMQHPHIARVFDAGLTDTGRSYFVMEYVNGISLTDYCDQHKLDIDARLALFMHACEAIKHAHHKGIIHRDIKPSNILVMTQDDAPVVKVIDFGIARATTQALTDKTLHTEQGQMIGTPEYMSPEQAGYDADIDTRTDIYSLGVVLYELLTGVLPFDAHTLRKGGPEHIRRVIQETNPPRPSTRLSQVLAKPDSRSRLSTLHSPLSTDLDWIVMKALEKDRNRRYESANDFVADIRRHLNNEPVLAARPSRIYRAKKFIRRNRVLVASAMTVAAILVVATAVSLGQMVRAKRERDLAEASERQTRLTLYAADMKAVQQNIDDGNIGAAQRLLQAYASQTSEDDLRGLEWRYLWKRAQGDHLQRFGGHTHWVTCVAFSPDGKRVASGGKDQSVIVRDKHGTLLLHHKTRGILYSMSFSRDGRYVATGNDKGEVLVWDTRDFTLCQQFVEPRETYACAGFSPAESRLAIVYGSGRVRLWDHSTDSKVRWLGQSRARDSKAPAQQGAALVSSALAFSKDGTLATFASGTGQYHIWDMDTLERIATLDNILGVPLYPAQHAAFVPGTDALLLGDLNNGLILWDFKSDEVTVPIGKAMARDIAQTVFSSDGTLMASAGMDHAVRLWEISGTAFREMARPLGHKHEVWAIAISSDNRRLATGGMDDDVLIWDTDPHSHHETVKHNFYAGAPCFSPDGQLIAMTGGRPPDIQTLLYDLEAARFLDTVVAGLPCAFGDNEAKIITCGMEDNRLMQSQWNLAKSRTSWKTDLGPAQRMPSAIPALCERRDLLATGWSDGSVSMVNRQNGTQLAQWQAHQGEVGVVVFSPDGRFILTAQRKLYAVETNAMLWSCSDLENIEPCYEIGEHRSWLFSAAFSPDGTILATGGVDSRLLLWDTATGYLHKELLGQRQYVCGLVFTRDGKTLASAHGDGTIRFWHVATARELTQIQLNDSAWSLALSPDDNTLAATSGSDPYAPDALHIWRIPSFAEADAKKE
jgi:eukaryotic-like serine/threonine-protein kinase